MNHFTYDELTPLEQCISDFFASQQLRGKQAKQQPRDRKEPTKQ